MKGKKLVLFYLHSVCQVVSLCVFLMKGYIVICDPGMIVLPSLTCAEGGA